MKKLIAVAAVMALALMLLPAFASAQVYVKNGGKLGIGDFETTDPIQPLHLKQPGNAVFQFESGNVGGVKFNFKIGGTGLFTISKVGTAGAEFLISEVNQPDTLLIDGGITADSFNLSSSREFKEGFEALSPSDVLATVAALPISRWQYKDDPNATRHIGPMAEDFYAAFGGATDKSISVSDATGVALAAIKGLHQQAQQKDQLIADLLSRIEKLERRLADQ
jgi:hypothetical protein